MDGRQYDSVIYRFVLRALCVRSCLDGMFYQHHVTLFLNCVTLCSRVSSCILFMFICVMSKTHCISNLIVRFISQLLCANYIHVYYNQLSYAAMSIKPTYVKV